MQGLFVPASVESQDPYVNLYAPQQYRADLLVLVGFVVKGSGFRFGVIGSFKPSTYKTRYTLRH